MAVLLPVRRKTPTVLNYCFKRFEIICGFNYHKKIQFVALNQICKPYQRTYGLYYNSWKKHKHNLINTSDF